MWDINPQPTQRHERSQPEGSAPVSNGCDPVSRFGRTAGLRRSQIQCCRPHARLIRQTVWVFPQKQGDIIPIALHHVCAAFEVSVLRGMCVHWLVFV